MEHNKDTAVGRIRSVYLEWKADDITAWIAMKNIEDILNEG